MKRFYSYTFILILLFIVVGLWANPVAPSLKITEIKFSETEWQIEIYGDYFEEPANLSECYIRCNADSAFFNDDYIIYEN